MSILLNIGVFILTILILVSFHELGHFWVARKLGVKVLRFSIGFGSALHSWRGRDGVEYIIASIPLGGYVKMLDSRETTVSPEEMHCEFNSQPLRNRVAIVAAGPLFNFILAIFLYTAVFMLGVSELRPFVGEATPGSIAAQAGLQKQDEILSIEQYSVTSWNDVAFALLNHDPEETHIRMQVRRADRSEQSILLNTGSINLLNDGTTMSDYGLYPLHLEMIQKPIIGKILAQSPAQESLLQVNDQVLAFNENPVQSWQQLVHSIEQSPGQEVMLTVRQEDTTENTENGAKNTERQIPVRIGTVIRNGRTLGRLGIQLQYDPNLFKQLQIHVRHNPADAFVLGIQKTWDMSVLSLKIIYRLITGNASPKNLSGPIAIAQFATQSMLAGITAYIGLLALLSISLGILNLLPIPVLDGGHLLYYLIEFLKGSPVSESLQMHANLFGIIFIASLTVFVFYNDLTRIFY